MQIQMMKLSEIHPYEKNPRFNDGAVEAVANSIKEFGFQQPIVVDKDLVVVVGHTRLKAAEQLGLTEVPVVIAENLTPEQVQAYRIADNRPARSRSGTTTFCRSNCAICRKRILTCRSSALTPTSLTVC